MSDQDVKEENKQQETPAQPITDPNELFSDQLKEIKNQEGGQKYNDVKTALEALKASQEYIPELTNELKQKTQEIERLRAELEKRKSVEQVVSKLADKQEPNLRGETASKETGLDEGVVKKIVEDVLQKNSQEARLLNNLSTVLDAMQEKYGEKAKDVIKSKASELGTTTEELKTLASNSPKVFLALFQDGKTSNPSPTINTSTLSDVGDSKKFEVSHPSKSLLYGATAREQLDYWKGIKKEVYDRLGVIEN